MKNFQFMTTMDVSLLAFQLRRRPDLWNSNPCRLGSKGPHRETRDIIVRYKDERPCIESDDWRQFSDEHIPMWYHAADKLPAAKRMALELMATAGGEMLGGVFIYSVPPGKRIYRHSDPGWHPGFFDKFNVCIESNPRARFFYPEDHESMVQAPGEVHWFRNDSVHEVYNEGDTDHIVMTVCMRLDRGERVPPSPEGWTMDASMKRWHAKEM